MSGSRWRSAHASVIGTSHTKTGSPCQDACGCRVVRTEDGSEVLLAAVADGAGSASMSQEGAALAVSRFLDEYAAIATRASDLSSCDRDGMLQWLANLNAEIDGIAQASGLTARDYACTFLGAIVGPQSAIYVQIGDGAIIASGSKPGDYDWVFWPQHGEFANQTNFVTMPEVEGVLEFETVHARVDEVALFSDGLERLVLNLADQKVHAPAFRPIFEWLARTEPGCPAGMSDVLVTYLGSDHVNGRTDDDKSLVMATRAPPPGTQPDVEVT